MKTLYKLLLITFLLSSSSAFAQTTYSWIGGSGNWGVATNWSPNGVPTATDNVVITATGTYTVTLDGDSTINDLTIGGSSGVQTLSLSSRTLTINGGASINDSGNVSLASSALGGIGTLTNFGTMTVSYSTFNIDLDNYGYINFTNNSSINNPLTTQPNSTIRISSPSGTNNMLTVANGFTNNGLIEFIATYHIRASILDITSGTLVNAAGGTIQNGSYGSSADYIYAPIDNQGSMIFNRSLHINEASAAHTNSGTITVNAGGLTLTQSGTTPSFTTTGTITVDSALTLAINGGTFNYDAGNLNLNGFLSASGAVLNFTPSFTNTVVTSLNNSTLNCTSDFTNQNSLTLTSSAISGGATLTNEDTISVSYGAFNIDIDNYGYINFTNSSSLNNPITTQTNSTIRVSSPSGNNNTLTVANGFINNGLLEFIATYHIRGSILDITNGTLVNAGGGTIQNGSYGSYADYINAPIDNQGTMIFNRSIHINEASAAHTNSGTITVNTGSLTLTQSGTTPSFTTTGTLAIDSTAALTVNGGLFDYASGVFTLSGSLTTSNATVDLHSSFNTITTTVTLNNSNITFNSPLTNQGDLSLTGSTLYGLNDFINQSSLYLTSSTIDSFTTLTNQDTMTVSYSAFNIDLDNYGYINFTTNSSINNPLTTRANSTIRVSSPSGNNNTLTVANGFTNNGLLEFIATYHIRGSILDITSGTLVNAGGGTIQNGSYGSYADYINAPIDNQGTMIFNRSLHINEASAAHTNSGTITVNAGGLTLTQSGTTPSFTTTGTITVDSALTLAINGGTFNYDAGNLDLNGFLSASSAVLNFTPSFTNTIVTSLNNSTLNCTSDFTNQNSLTLTSSAISGGSNFTNEDTISVSYGAFNIDIDNYGYINFTNSSSLNNPITTQTNSTIRVSSPSGNNNTLTVANGFINNGLLDFIATYHIRGSILDITNGTLVNAGGGTIQNGSYGSYADYINAPIDNQGTMIFNRSIHINKANESFFNSGEIQINNATVTFSGNQFENMMAGEIGGNGTLNISGIIFVNNGSFIPGNYPGILNIQNDLPSAATAFLNYDLGGPIIAEFYNSIAVAQTANFDGTLNINLVDGYVPNVGQEFVLATCNTHNGSFLVENGLSINAWKEFELVFDLTELKLITRAISGQMSPYAYDDFATANDDVEIFVDVLYNDVDPTGENLNLISVGPANNGVTQVGINNMVSYTPDSLFTGEDRFIYTIENTSGCQTSGMVTVTVNPAIPTTPLLAYPADSSVDVSYDVTLGWYFATEIDSYQVQLSDVPTFNSGNEILVVGIVDTLTLVSLSSQSTYYWRVLSQNSAGASAWSVTWNFTTGTFTGVEDEFITLPKEFALRQNYPNPFNPTTTIEYDLPKASKVKIEIYNLLGKKVKTILDDYKDAGSYKFIFDSNNLASGVYFYRIQADVFTSSKKMILLR